MPEVVTARAVTGLVDAPRSARGGCTVTAKNSSELGVSREVYSMTAARDALWIIRNSVGRMRDLPSRRQMIRAMWFDAARTAL